MHLRLIGAVLLLSAAVYLGAALSQCARQRVRELEAFCRFLSEIRDAIAGMQLPLDEIFAEKHTGVLSDNGFFAMLRAAAAEGADAPLAQTIAKCAGEGRLALSDEDLTCLRTFAAGLGQGDCQTEIRRCEYCLSRLEKRYAEAEKAAPAYIRMMRILPVSVAGLLIILLF